MSIKTFRSLPDRRQRLLLPPSLDEWLPEDHLAYFVLDVVEQLDLGAIYAHYERELRGFPPHEPKMMVALLLYGYCVGVPSSRKIERRTHEDLAFRLIACGQHPDHTCISEFRRIHRVALTGLYAEGLVLCHKAGLVKLGHVALDGTKVKASASKHKAMSYDRMKEHEAELTKKVDELMRAAEEADAAEDVRYGRNRRGDELPEDLRRAESRLAKIRAAKAEIEAEAKQQKSEGEKRDDDPPSSGGTTPLPNHRIPCDAQGTPTPKAQRNFTDAESRIQKSGDGFVQGYNCQIVVDAEHQIIVAQAVTNQPPDVEHLVPMMERVIESCGVAPTKATADAGYFSAENVTDMKKLGIEPFIATGRRKHNEPAPTVRGRPRASMSIKEQMARTLATKKGAAVYARRKAIVEPVFGQIKQVRGFRQFLMRGIERVRVEWSLVCMTHNLLKLFRAAAVP